MESANVENGYDRVLLFVCVCLWVSDALCDLAVALLTRRLAREMVRAVASASCWHLSLSAVAFSNLAVSLARFSLRC